MAVTHHKSSRTIRGITYAYNSTFVCYAANKGTAGSEGNGGSAAALTKGETYTFKGYATDDYGDLTSYPYLVADSLGNTRGWYKENVFPYKTYTIKYNANGGSGAPGNQTKTYNTNITISNTKPTKTGYAFSGWNTKADGTGTNYAVGATYSANADVTLYAKWTANTYTISYNGNGEGVSGVPENQTKNHGTNITLSSAIPTRANYTFKGWGTSAGATTVAYAAGASYTKNEKVTLYAIWELAYTKPRIAKLSVKRVNASGEEDQEGGDINVCFDWESDLSISSIKLKYRLTTSPQDEATEIDIIDYSSGGSYSGEVNYTSKWFALAVSSSYIIEITVSDSNGSTTKKVTVNSLAFTIHAKEGGDGIAFGKTSELPDTAEFAFDAKFNKPVYGKALGMDKLPEITSGEDFNEYLEPGCYAVYKNATAALINNIPVPRAGRLEVWASTGEGIRTEEQYSYLTQRFVPYNRENAAWERDITRSASNEWTFYNWFKTNLTPDLSERLYNKSALTVALTANITSLTTSSYTKIVFNNLVSSMGDFLSLSDGSVRIGSGISFVKASAKILFKVLAQGSKHFKISKISNGTITHYSWVCQEVDQIKNSAGTAQATGVEFDLMPIIIPVKEGDYITCTYYTTNSTDYIVAGSTANGYQTYLTVETL